MHAFNRMPTLMQPNDTQNVIFIGSPEDGIFLCRGPNSLGFVQKNVLKANYIKRVKSVAYDAEEGAFYIMCNWFAEKLGFYVVKVDPMIDLEGKFLVKWKNRLDMDDAYVSILRDAISGLKELVIAFKIIYENIYSIFVLDISVEDSETVQFRHDSFQLYESNCSAILLNNPTRDFIHCN